MELRTILLSLMVLVIVGIIVLILYQLYMSSSYVIPSGISPVKTSVLLIDTLHGGRDYLKLDNALPRSQNEDDGIEFTYAAWILVNDYDSGKKPVIFVKGMSDLSLQAPSVTMRGDRNEIHIVQDTYKNDSPGKVVVRNLPAGKMIHLAISINQKSMEVFVNGTLYQHLTLAALPLQNTGAVYVADNGGWKGLIGTFTYYNYSLTPQEVRSLANTKPKRDPNDIPPYAPYLDTSWWINKY
jgi:hypothetical protein